MHVHMAHPHLTGGATQMSHCRYEPLDPSRLSLNSFRTTRLGRMLTRSLVNTLETLKVRYCMIGSAILYDW